jgi:hypothetical protein
MATLPLHRLLAALTAAARQLRLSDAAWARRAGVPKETLCRLRARSSCDFATLDALAAALSLELEARPTTRAVSEDGCWPRHVDRAYEARVLDVLASGATSHEAWRALGPRFFVAGLAVTLASVRGFDRARYLALAERLHPGSTTPDVYRRWLAGTPLPPDRFLPPLLTTRDRAEATTRSG